jgi:hypothetical protein
LASLTETDLRTALTNAIRPDDECIWISGGIWTFASRLGWPVAETPSRVLDVVLDVIGPSRTLLLPSYTFSYAKTRQYDSVETPPETGVLQKAALGNPAFQRTVKPINNYLVTGPRADEIMALPCTTAWGADSVLAWVEDNDVRICMIGVPWHDACSFFHRAEEVFSVPYRFYKRFPGTLLRAGKTVGTCEETMFVCSLSVRPQFDWRRISSRIADYGEVLSGAHPMIFIESTKAKAIHQAGLSVLREDPYGILTNAPQVRDWVAHQRTREIGELLPCDQTMLNR